MHIPTLIAKKRDGSALSAGEIRFVIEAFTAGDLPDYQMSALAMAIYFQGMDEAETAALTAAMLESGERLAWPGDAPPVVDKHSTGGIGDKVSLPLAPLLACDGLWVPMMSGRGLGITGGTLDKLESIPGYRTALGAGEILAQVRSLGCAMFGQTDRICPADKRLYALRDVTGTVPSRPLITASIMGKKLAESLDRLVLDVKFGSGAFMQTRGEAQLLADAMVAAGERNGVRTRARLTPMDEPLGRTAGNALEVAEAIECLEGGGPADLRDLVLDLAAEVADSPRERLAEILDSGAARERFAQMLAAQGGDPGTLGAMRQLHAAPVVRDFPAPQSGVVRKADAGTIGRAALVLGAGRAKTGDAIDFAAGFDQIKKVGEPAEKGEPLCRIHARTERAADEAAALLGEAFLVEGTR